MIIEKSRLVPTRGLVNQETSYLFPKLSNANYATTKVTESQISIKIVASLSTNALYPFVDKMRQMYFLQNTFVRPAVRASSSPQLWQREPHLQGPLSSLMQSFVWILCFLNKFIFNLWSILVTMMRRQGKAEEHKIRFHVFEFHCLFYSIPEFLLLYQLW